MVKRILGFFTAACLGIFLLVPLAPSAAASGSYIGSTTYWDQFLLTIVHSTSGIPFLGQGVQSIAGALGGGVCSGSEDALHHATALSDDKVYEDNTGMYSYGTCIYCGARFKVYSDDFADAYDDAVHELSVTGVTSSGDLMWIVYPNSLHFAYERSSGDIPSVDFPADLSAGIHTSDGILFSFDDVTWSLEARNFKGVSYFFIEYFFELIFPFDCIVSVLQLPRLYCSLDFGSLVEFEYPSSFPKGTFLSGEKCSLYIDCEVRESGKIIQTFYETPLIFKITPKGSSTITSDYVINFRPSNISGNYGVVGDDGQLTQLEDVTIVDEDSSTVYNPVTNTTSNITDWTYDYSDRSYELTLDTGETVTVTYGDQNVTIQDGDTVYNVYYVVDGETEDPVETPGGGSEECQHEYTSEVTREPTCTFTGVTTYTCSLCGETYTESIPAIGHSWAVKETVQTSYDEDGTLLQQGYTIYKCSVCGEEYKDETGTGPPSGGGSGSEEGGGILDKLGQLIGTVLGGIVKVLEAVAGKLLDALIALVEMIAEKLGAVVELVLSFFDEIPQLFAGFLSFLGAVFPFFPEEVTLLLTFGIAVVVFIGIIKALRR